MNTLRPVYNGGGKVALVDGTGTAVSVVQARGFYVYSDVDTLISVRGDDTTGAMDDTNATMIAGGVLYGPFQLMGGVDKFIHVAGDGATGDCYITLV